MGSFPRTDRHVMRYTGVAERGGQLERKTCGHEHSEHPSGFSNALTIGGRSHELHRSAPVFSIRCDAGSGTQIGGTLGFADRGGTMSMKIVNWNVRWATPRSKHSARDPQPDRPARARARLSHGDALRTAPGRAHDPLPPRLRLWDPGNPPESAAVIEGALGPSG